jgi:hypothetical protein
MDTTWRSSQLHQQLCGALDHDDYEDFVKCDAGDANPMDGAFFDGVILANQHGQQFLHRLDINGNALAQLNVVSLSSVGS